MSEQNMNPEEEVVTVTLTLDNDEVVECAVLTVYTANDKEYIALLPLNEEGESEDGDVYLYSLTLKMMMSTRLQLTLLTSGWMNRNLKNYKF